MATNKGTVKRCKLTDFSSVRKNGLKAIVLNDGEELISVKITDGSNSILLATHDGMAIHFDEQDVRCMSRAAHGVKGSRLHDGDYVVATGCPPKPVLLWVCALCILTMSCSCLPQKAMFSAWMRMN